MTVKAEVKYERVSPRDVKVTYSGKGESIVVVARVVKRGSYSKSECTASPSNSSESSEKGEG